MELEQPDFLTPVRADQDGLGYATVYAVDEQGNVWRTRQVDGSRGEWRLFKKASEIVQPTLSWEQMLEMGRKQMEQGQ